MLKLPSPLISCLFSGFVFLSSSAAHAADYALPPPPEDYSEPELRPSVMDWTGLEVGAYGAGACVEASYTSTVPSGPYEIGGCRSMVGILTGVNYQIDSVVVGLEGDYGWSLGSHIGHVGGTEQTNYYVKGLGTIRSRLGYLVTSDLLLYVTGGVGWLDTAFDGLVGQNPVLVRDSDWLFGWVIGGGMETSLTQNLHLRAEYLYGRFDKNFYDLTAQGCANVCGANMNAQNFHALRAGVEWRFSGLFF